MESKFTFVLNSQFIKKNGHILILFYYRPVEDRFSLMVILVMAVGLGLPAVVLFIGGLAIAIRNYRMKKDDLLLSN